MFLIDTGFFSLAGVKEYQDQYRCKEQKGNSMPDHRTRCCCHLIKVYG